MAACSHANAKKMDQPRTELAHALAPPVRGVSRLSAEVDEDDFLDRRSAGADSIPAFGG